MISVFVVELIDKDTGKKLGNLNWDGFQKGINEGKYLITNHIIDFESCTGKTIQTLQVSEIEQFDLVKEWKNKNSQLLKCRLSDYNVYFRYNDGLMLISDKGVLVDKTKIRTALNIPYVPIFEIPCCVVGIGNTVCENTIIINMTRLMEVIEEYKQC